MTKLETIRAACIKANPEIVELKFGCEVSYEGWECILLDVPRQNPAMWVLAQSKTLPDEETDGEVYIPDCEIIGRPIRLADVLLAIGKDEKDIYFKNSDTTIPKWKIIHSDITGSSIGWNLLKDDLTLQSDETIDFLSTLIEPVQE